VSYEFLADVVFKAGSIHQHIFGRIVYDGVHFFPHCVILGFEHKHGETPELALDHA